MTDHQHHGGGDCCHGAAKPKTLPKLVVLQRGAPAPKQPPVLQPGQKAVYICPMHPAVRQEGPGTCPVCGMALEPEVFTLDDGPNHELIDMTRRLQGAVLLGLPVFLSMWALPWLDRGHFMSMQAVNHLQMLFATPVVLWAGWPFFRRGWDSIKSLNFNMFTLIAIGTGVAWLYSVAATLAPALFPAAFRQADGSVAVYFDAAAMITALVLLGQVLELRAREKTGDAIRALMALAPKTARRVGADGAEADVPLEDVSAGDLLRVRPGEKVPVDGVVTDGHSTIDAAMVTGEAMPVACAVGDAVTGGTINQSGSFIMRAEKVGADTLLSRIVAMVAEAQRSRAPVQALADRFAMWFVPGVIAVALFSAFCWVLFGPAPVAAHALLAAVSVLIIACPCALGLATPMSVMVGMGRGARAGVLIRNAEALERLEKADTLVLDKTGTLTEGKPRVTQVQAAAGFDDAAVLHGFYDAAVLRYAAALEKGSEHPLAAAVLSHAAEKDVAVPPVTAFAAVTGKGVTGTVEGHAAAFGNAALMQAQGVDISALATAAEELRAAGATVVFLSIDAKAAGLLAIADPVKVHAADNIAALRKNGLRIVMLTGDSETTARAVARQLGIDEVTAGVSPEDKGRIVKELQEKGAVVAMAGDGTNDAPALAAADIGIAMGTGTDVALQSAGVTLLHGDLAGILRARKLSRAVMRNIRQNLFFAFFYNMAGVPVAGGLLFPVFGLLLSPAIAAAAMSLSSVSVISNALRLKWTKL